METATEKVHRVFKNDALNDQLHRLGYIVTDFLNPAEVTSLVDFFYAGEESKREQFTTFATDDYSYKRLVDETIKKVFQRSFQELFCAYLPFWGNFFLKKPHAPAMPLHADLQYVEEPENISLNIWCPLVDTDERNGTLGIVPSSHSLMKQIRGTNITDSYRRHAKEIELAFGKLIPLRAGQALIYDHRLLHYSPSNNTDAARLAATLTVLPESVPVYHYYAGYEGDTTVYKYLIESIDDFLKTDFLKRPAHLVPVQAVFNHTFSPLTVADFQPNQESAPKV